MWCGNAWGYDQVADCFKPCADSAYWQFCADMFAANKQQTTKLWMWRMEYLHHEQRPLYFGEWF